MSFVFPRRRRTPALLGAIAAIVIAALVVALFLWRPAALRTPLKAPTIDSLAVLPLANLSGDSSQGYFADGMTEALIAELAKLKALKVISRTSVMRFKGTTKPLPEIARELGVRGVIEGAVQRVDDEVRITVQLIDAPHDRNLWAESYTRTAREVLRLQAEVAKAIAREVNVAVTPEEDRALSKARDVNPEAHRLLLQATDLMRHGSSQSAELKRISDLVARALEIAPDYAYAHVVKATTLWSAAGIGAEGFATACPRARRELAKALALEPRSLQARSLEAMFAWSCDHDWKGAERGYHDLVREVPGDALLHDYYAGVLSLLEKNREALDHSRRAFELDPLNDWIGGRRIAYLRRAGRIAESMEQARKVLAFSPQSVYVTWELGNSEMAAGDLKDAIATYLSRDVGTARMNFKVGVAWARSGAADKARKVLAYLVDKRNRRYVPAAQIADIYANLGERAKALDWLETSYREGDFFLVWLLREKDFDPIRSEPRFAAIVHKLNLS